MIRQKVALPELRVIGIVTVAVPESSESFAVRRLIEHTFGNQSIINKVFAISLDGRAEAFLYGNRSFSDREWKDEQARISKRRGGSRCFGSGGSLITAKYMTKTKTSVISQGLQLICRRRVRI